MSVASHVSKTFTHKGRSGYISIRVRDITRILLGPIRSQYGLSCALQVTLMFAFHDMNTQRLIKRDVHKMASARIDDYDATKITFRTFHWYSYCYTDVPRPSCSSCEGVACETSVAG